MKYFQIEIYKYWNDLMHSYVSCLILQTNY